MVVSDKVHSPKAARSLQSLGPSAALLPLSLGHHRSAKVGTPPARPMQLAHGAGTSRAPNGSNHLRGRVPRT